jgi:GT2 family glycosyltransferase
MGIHRDLFARIGGFGGLRHGQDIEFSHRMIQNGARIVYIRDSVVYHKRRTSLSKFYRQVFNWGVARINLFRIDAKMLEPLHAAPAAGFWLAVLFTVLALIFPILRPAWIVLAGLAVLLFLVSGVHAALRWKSPVAGLLTPVVMILQISGYALGFTTAFVWRVILRRGEWTGFVKRYYK